MSPALSRAVPYLARESETVRPFELLVRACVVAHASRLLNVCFGFAANFFSQLPLQIAAEREWSRYLLNEPDLEVLPLP